MRAATAESAPAVAAALDAYEQANIARTAVVRTLTLLAILGWLLVNYGLEVARENALPFAILITTGLVRYGLHHGHPERRWIAYLFIVIDIVVVTVLLLAPGHTYPDVWPWQTVLRQPSFLYLLVFLALVTLSFRPLLVLWTGLVVAVVWSIGTGFVLRAPGTLSSIEGIDPVTSDDPELLARYLDPSYVHIDDAVVRVFITLVLTGILALAALRARQLVFRQAEAARARANLSRYLAPSMVERLAATDRPLGAVRTQAAAVLFADMKKFSTLAADLGPEASMQLLRDFHGRMAEAVFAHGGTLDKFIGDGLMATFGTPETAPDGAARAIACARAMHASLARWNDKRRPQGQPALGLGVGIHHGMVTMGDIGGSGRFELAVIGDSVNAAFRIERLTRDLDRGLLVSEAAAIAAGLREGAGWVRIGSFVLRGHELPTVLWASREGAPPPS